MLLSKIRYYFEEHGILINSCERLRAYLLSELPSEIVPSVTVLRAILRDRFHLKYKRTEKNKTKYRDPDLNEKRLWVSRLLAQFIYDGTVIVSIDESGFRHDPMPSRQWQFDSNALEDKTLKPKKKKRHPNTYQPVNLLLRTDTEL